MDPTPPACGPGAPPFAVWLLMLSDPDCTPPDPFEEEVIRLTSVKDGPVKQVAYEVPFCNNVMVKGPRTSVSKVCQVPDPEPVLPVPDDPEALDSVLMQSGAADDGADDVVGIALQPA
jgi:hypothetical protein